MSTALMTQLGGIVPRVRTPSASVTKNSHPASMALIGSMLISMGWVDRIPLL